VKKAAIILAGGLSRRFGIDKCMIKLMEKPLVFYVYGEISGIVDEVIVVAGSFERRNMYSHDFPSNAKIVVDERNCQSPLVGALTGFMNSRAEYSVLLPCDTPFVSKGIINYLFRASLGFDAVIPRWPNGYLEPLQAVYRTESALDATRMALGKGEVRLKSMISLLKRVKYVPTKIIKQVDPHLLTFFNVNTPADLKRAEKFMRKTLKFVKVKD
jgi:molybdopterin-guanine dinucleotide biosynthesis protein A